MATYPANTNTPPHLAPLDGDEVLHYDVDWSDWLNTGDSIAASDWDVPAGIGIGDGSTAVATPAGSTTPPAPVHNLNSSTKTRAYLYVDGAGAGIYTIENSVLTAAGIAGSRSFKVVVGDK